MDDPVAADALQPLTAAVIKQERKNRGENHSISSQTKVRQYWYIIGVQQKCISDKDQNDNKP